MYNLQEGGLDPLHKVPKFKYTFNEERKLFIGYLYPYADYFINCVTSMPFDSYSFSGNCEYIHYNPSEKSETQKIQEILPCSSIDPPLYHFFGGSVYEILNKKFNNVNLYDYCDATGDIDVALYLPKLKYNGEFEDYSVLFFNIDGHITSYYSDFTKWTFENMVKNVESIQLLFSKMDNVVPFDIAQYSDIKDEFKYEGFGYCVKQIGKVYVVGFLTEDRTMFKIQVVCKIEDSEVSVIDHVIEIVIALPTIRNLLSPADDAYSRPDVVPIILNTKTYKIQTFNHLVGDNISAYIQRKGAYGKINESEFIHKSVNHIARLFYLFELIYQNQTSDEFEINKIALLSITFMKPAELKELEFLYYYKIINDAFHTIRVETRFFLNAYFQIIIANKWLYDMFIRKNPDYFLMEKSLLLHDRFITELFTTQGGDNLIFGGNKEKRRKKTRKLKTNKNKKK